jgi:hypothetical protein
MTRSVYGEGDWFAVPLRNGGFGVGLIARANSNGGLLGYFFGPRHVRVPVLSDLVGLSARDAVLIGKIGHLGLKQGKWPVLGRTAGWDRNEWPMPVFIRHEELSGRSYRVFYDPHDPNRLLREERVLVGETARGPEDGLMGAQYAEIRLSRLLD